MSIADQIDDALKAERPSHTCKVCWILEQVSEEDRIAISGALDRGLSAPKLAKILTNNGYEASRSAVHRHTAHLKGTE